VSTNDVPGAKAANKDVLAMGAWAEHDDGSLIFVEAVEGGRVIYSMFDLAPDPPVEYRDGMVEDTFKRTFSWKPAGGIAAIRWTWHDKTVFPWERIMGDFPSGQKHASVEHQMTAAARVAESLDLRAGAISHDRPTTQRAGRGILERLHDAVGALRS
jgi:hypothetical protein